MTKNGFSGAISKDLRSSSSIQGLPDRIKSKNSTTLGASLVTTEMIPKSVMQERLNKIKADNFRQMAIQENDVVPQSKGCETVTGYNEYRGSFA